MMDNEKILMLRSSLYLKNRAQMEYDAALAQKNSAHKAFSDVLHRQFLPNDAISFVKEDHKIQNGHVVAHGTRNNILVMTETGQTVYVTIKNILDVLDVKEGKPI